MEEDYKVTLCLSGEERTPEEHLRDEIEVLKAEIYNLKRMYNKLKMHAQVVYYTAKDMVEEINEDDDDDAV